jgi:hypothetical protein
MKKTMRVIIWKAQGGDKNALFSLLEVGEQENSLNFNIRSCNDENVDEYRYTK